MCAVGLVLTTGPAWAFLIAPALIGIGYGPITPASSQLLAHTAPPHRMALTFSIKQTGVPLGAALAGALLPLITMGHGWRVAVWAVAGSGVVIALLSQPTRAGLDVGLVREHRVSLDRLFAPLKLVACAVPSRWNRPRPHSRSCRDTGMPLLTFLVISRPRNWIGP